MATHLKLVIASLREKKVGEAARGEGEEGQRKGTQPRSMLLSACLPVTVGPVEWKAVPNEAHLSHNFQAAITSLLYYYTPPAEN